MSRHLLAVSIAAVVLVFVMATGCATTVPSSGGDPLAALNRFTTADLQAALADATAHQDQAAANCYRTLLAIVPTLRPATLPTIKGAVSAFQAQRDLLRSTPAGLPAVAQQVNLGCAALFVDTQATLAKLGLIGAAIAK